MFLWKTLSVALRPTAAAIALLASGQAIAGPGNTHTTTGVADVTVVEPIGIQNVADLRFGRIVRPTTGGTLTISPAGAVTETGGVTGQSSTPQATNGRGPGAFAVFGDANRYFLIFMPNSTTISNGTANMQVNQFQTNPGAFGPFHRLNNAGYAPLLVGARLNVNANQAVGQYTGNFNVTVLYL
ncbi:MAG: DUF4402 domain-containing protein [Sphingomonadaceae bacterium]|jgi:spore coat protein U-like protein|nr:DUF4402 domain-containing protein [Sphingomonadaceae bacterium]MCP5383018.1 DUF4402 domain-containing protein [Altererythrobacter sp.]MCP5391132.1 DUF4402 domain-containing protein [Sphingomonadaceae bacterium]MCP5393201.1 DUF4402 domain-containing protein [Sphingomonadaceae bacterium]